MGIESPWHVIDVRLDAPTATVEVVAEFRGDPCCPKCRKNGARLRLLSTSLPSPRHVSIRDSPDRRCASDRVRQEGHRELLAEGDATITKTKYVWLQKPNKMKRPRRLLLTQLIHSSLRTARAWALKETASKLWHCVSETWARRAWNEWIGWTKNCKLEPMIGAASMVPRHLDGIINAIVLKTTNALGESMNAKIQKIKSQARGNRNRQRFPNAIMFQLLADLIFTLKPHQPTRIPEAPELSRAMTAELVGMTPSRRSSAPIFGETQPAA